MKNVTTKTSAVNQKTQRSLNNINGIVIKENSENEIIVRLDNGLTLPFDKSELIYNKTKKKCSEDNAILCCGSAYNKDCKRDKCPM